MQAEIQLHRVSDDRRDSRHVAYRDGEIEPAGADSVPAKVTDLSRAGFRAVVDEPLSPESVIWLKVGEYGPFMARVVWYDGSAAGCEFAGKLHPHEFRHILYG